MDNTNLEMLNAPIKPRYNLSTKAIRQRVVAAKKPRGKGKKALLMILENHFDAQFKKLLIQYSLKILKKRCEECKMKKNGNSTTEAGLK
jgi:hypothetical protein